MARHTASVTIRVDGEKVIYDYRSLLRHRHLEIDPDDIEQITPDVISMWRGNVTEKLVMRVAGEELEVVPIYSESDPDVQGIYDAVNVASERRRLRRDSARRRAEEAEAAGEQRETVWAVFEASLECPSCGAPVPVEGLVESAECPSCGNEIDLGAAFWADMLEDDGEELREMEPNEASRSQIMSSVNVGMMYGRLDPYCPSCKDRVEVEEVPESGRVACPACGTEVEVEGAPPWVSEALDGADLVVGPVGVRGPGDEDTPSPPESVAFTCPKCGADLRVDGSDRVQECEYCGLIFMLPDDLWSRFHPAPTRKRWFIRLT
jgi:predicted RNA-binding Zn-ribbon protein involved in translation (DUF1610 family)